MAVVEENNIVYCDVCKTTCATSCGTGILQFYEVHEKCMKIHIEQLDFIDEVSKVARAHRDDAKKKFKKPPMDDGEKMYLAPDEVRREPYRDLIKFWTKKIKELEENW